MKQLISAFTLIVLLLTACHKPDPTPQPKPNTEPTSGNSFKVEFKATPEVFPADGGKGKIEGILKEVSPEGKVVKESPISKSDFTLSLKRGDASQIQINKEAKEVTIAKGSEEATFTLVAQMKKDKALSQELILKREKGEAPKPQIITPLNFVAEYDINPEGNAFVDSYASNVAGYFNFDEAVKRFSDISIDGKKYHLPSKEEWLAIVPEYTRNDYVNFEKQVVYNDIQEKVVVAGKEITSTNDYRGNVESIAYAIRFKGTNYISAWRYEYKKENDVQVLKITVLPLKEAPKTPTIEDVTQSSFWKENENQQVVRLFPASGYKNLGSLLSVGTYGYFWSASDDGPGYAWMMNFRSSFADVYANPSTLSSSIRLFLTD